MRTGVKWGLGLAAALLALVLVISGTLVFLMNTTSGSHWAVQRMAALGPGAIVFDGLDGTLWRGLGAERVTYDDGKNRVEVDALAVSINWAKLPAGTLELKHLDAAAIRYRGLSDDESAADTAPLSLQPLPVEIRIVQSRVGSISVATTGDPAVLENLLVAGLASDGRDILVRSVEASMSGVTASAADLKTTISSNWPLSAKVRWRLDDNTWTGQGRVQGSLDKLHFDQQVSGPYPALVSGSLQPLLPAGPQLDMLINWERWTIGDQEFVDGEVRAAGWLDAFTMEYDATLEGIAGQRFAVIGSAAGNTEGMDSVTANLAGTGGNAEFKGSVRWSPAVEVQGMARAMDVDPAIFVDGLTGNVETEARLAIADSVIALRQVRASGDINGYPAKASGDVRLAASRLRCSDCQVEVGSNRLRLDGALSEADVTMALRIDAGRIEELVPGASGSVTGDGSISGELADLALALELQGRGLRFGDDRLPQLDADTSLTLRRDRDGLAGTLQRATLSTSGDLRWTLQNTMRFSLEDTTFSVDPHRWTGTTGDLWVEALSAGPDDEVVVAGRIAQLPLSLAEGWLPPNLRLIGVAEADIDLRRSENEWTGDAEWRQADASLRVIDADNRHIDVSIPSVSVVARFVNGGLDVDASVAIEPGVTGRLDFAVSPVSPDGIVAAELALSGDDWRWISAVVPQIDQFEGSINALVRASGPVSSPELNGNLAWRGGALLVPSLNVPLREIELVVSGGTRGTATLAGSAQAGDGQLRLAGRFDDLMRPERSLRLEVTGDAAEIVNWPEYRLWATPDLVIAGFGDEWRVDGKLGLPQAAVALRELPEGAVEVSPDVVVLGEAAPESRPTRLSGEVDVSLGDRVQIDALGLKARLSGELLLRLRENQPAGAEGRIVIADGLFEAYGQKLTIRDGTLTFTGPLDDPLVDVRAVRTVETFDGTVVAGLHLTGRAQNLSTTVFSDPAMAEADALSYLVVGRPLNQATEAEGGDLTGAAVALGLKQAGRLVEQIGQSLGLDQLSLTGDGGETTALVAGKQVNKQLYARYAYGVFSRLGTLLLRYRLSERITLEAGAGDNQSIDILYSRER